MHIVTSKLWFLLQHLPNLKDLDLSHSQNLIEMPDLSGVPHLRNLNLQGCTKIVRIDPSIGTLRELVRLNLRNCKNLFLNLNIIFGLSSLVVLNLSGCYRNQGRQNIWKKLMKIEVPSNYQHPLYTKC